MIQKPYEYPKTYWATKNPLGLKIPWGYKKPQGIQKAVEGLECDRIAGAGRMTYGQEQWMHTIGKDII